jgi:hypothetical protein
MVRISDERTLEYVVLSIRGVFLFSLTKKSARKGLRFRDTFCGNFVSKSLKVQRQLHIYSELIYKSEVAGDCQFNLSAKYCARRTGSGGFIIRAMAGELTSPATDRPAPLSFFKHFNPPNKLQFSI